MISVSEAHQIIEANTLPLAPLCTPLKDAVGKILSESVYAITDIPGYPQSGMDGYALLYSDWKLHKTLSIKGEVAAGSMDNTTLARGEATRIFTGAPLPNRSDTVVMQEKVTIKNGELIILDEGLQQGANVRRQGSEINLGEIALERNTLLTPAAIGFLAGIGIASVKVFPNPTISLIITGKELQQPGSTLRQGGVYESNSYLLAAALEQLQFKNVQILWVDDDFKAVFDALDHALQRSDVVLLSGGVSVGDYDFVLPAAAQCGVTTMFHKIKQKPGKPLYFGKKENKIVFGLPGNPSSVLTCFYEYVLSALSLLSKRSLKLLPLQVALKDPIRKSAGLTQFFKGYYNGSAVAVLQAQESYRLSSFAKANCLIKIEEAISEVAAGETVEIHTLSF